ncbi:hypothetical protein B0H14DRAFT_1680917 [Mycena olivaceomarginata]|nr:hypothetical protein B0H14DRAFT_1680917 [Mycena olivaceomarginata]
MAPALDLGRFCALDTEHPSTEADDLPGLETAAPAVKTLTRSWRTGSSSRPLYLYRLDPSGLAGRYPRLRNVIICRPRRPRSHTICLPSAASRRSASCRCPSSCKYSCPEINPKINPNSSAEWASTTQKALASPISATASTSTPELSSETHFESAMQSVEERTPDERSAHIEERQAEHEREMDLGLEPLHAAVDQGLGLIPGGMTWFDAGILPGSGRASPSVYSCDQHSTPSLNPPTRPKRKPTRRASRCGSASIASLVAALPGPAAAPPGYVVSTQN